MKNSRTAARSLLLVLMSMAVVATAPHSPFLPSAHAESLGAWTATNNPPSPTQDGTISCPTFGSYVYCIGSIVSSTSTDAYYAPLSSSGIGSWTTDAYPYSGGNGGILAVSCRIDSGYMHCVGGETQGSGKHPINKTYVAPVSSFGIGTWTRATDYPVVVADADCVVSGGYMYCIGGTTYSAAGHGLNASYYAPISSSGIGAWTQTTSYPTGTHGQSCEASGGYVYCVAASIGSCDGVYLCGPNPAVYYAALSSSGVGPWTSTTAYPIAVSFLACTISADSH